MEDDLTEVQRDRAIQAWVQWKRAQALTGRKVRWKVGLVQARERKYEIDDLTAYVRNARDQVEILTSAPPYSSSRRELLPVWKRELTESSARLRAIQARPIELWASIGPDRPIDQRIIIRASLRGEARNAVRNVDKGGFVILEGQISALQCLRPGLSGPDFIRLESVRVPILRKGQPMPSHLFWAAFSRNAKLLWPEVQPGEMMMLVLFEGAEIVDPRAVVAGPAPKAPAPSPEQSAQTKLRLADAYRAAQLPDRAQAVLKSVIEDFPDTLAAEQARGRLAEINRSR